MLVRLLYGRSARDPPHSESTLLQSSEIEERRFAGWRMGSVDLKRVNPSTLLRTSHRAVLGPSR